ncbi:MAG: flavin reductase family protein [Desulfurococcales archaeon]|nr:flavin reductase family protein [Desulfurococcales archaeon]
MVDGFFMQIPLRKAYRLLHPRPVVVIVSIGRDGRVNGCAVSWITPVNVDPPIIAFSLAPSRYTYRLLKESGEVTVNIMGFSNMEKTHYVGTVSGKDIGDKLGKAGFKLKPSKKIKAPGIADALAILECRVVKEIEFTDHNLVVAEVLHAEAKQRVFKNNIVSEDARPLLHVGGSIYTTVQRYHSIEEY